MEKDLCGKPKQVILLASRPVYYLLTLCVLAQSQIALALQSGAVTSVCLACVVHHPALPASEKKKATVD